MAESCSSGDEEFKGEAKYKQFSAAVERALKGFELSAEWHDLISSLARLNKTLLAYKQYPAVPHHLLVSKRLSQCLHHNLPGGVHLKALDVYRAIFDRIGSKGLTDSLLVYSSGLFPLLSHGSMSVRPSLLDIYEKYYLAVGRGLIPCLPGMVLGLLPGLEDESEHTERITCLLDALCVSTDEPAFYSAMWQCVLSSSRGRLPAVNYILSKLSKKATAEDQTQYLGGSLPLMVCALCSALQDKNVLICRATLDVILALFPLHRPFLLPSDIVLILSAALETLLRRDMSLNRRLYSWLLGTQTDKTYMETHFPDVARVTSDPDSFQALYFDKFTKSYLLSALYNIINNASQATKHVATHSDSILPYRLMRSLMDKPEIGDVIVTDILPDLTSCLKIQVECLGGGVSMERSSAVKPSSQTTRPSSMKDGGSGAGSGGKKSGKKSHKFEILQSANLFFNALAPEQLWQWMESLLSRTITATVTGERMATHEITQGLSRDQKDDKETGLRRREGELNNYVPSVVSSEKFGGESLPSSPVYPSSPVCLGMGVGAGPREGGGGVQLSCSSACRLIHFLLHILPLETMEDVYIHHLPHLCCFILYTLSSQEPKSRCLQHCLDLLLYCVHKIVQETTTSGSHTDSPVTTPTGQLTAGPALTGHADKLKWKLLTQFSIFFSKFINSRISNVCNHDNRAVDHTHSSQGVTGSYSRGKVSVNMERCFVSGCHLLCLLAQLSISQSVISGEDRDSTSTSWLSDMKTLCTGSHDHHMTFTALETLLTLLSHENFRSVTRLSHDIKTAVDVLCPTISSITKDNTFIDKVTRYLWDCLCPSLTGLHVEASSLLCWTHTLCLTSHTCETTILMEFTTESVDVYQRFSTLWQHSPDQIHGTPCRPFNRAVLRMLEGLQSREPAIRALVEAWIHSSTTRGHLQSLISPLVSIILQQNDKRKVYTPSSSSSTTSTGSLVEDSGKYYYSPTLAVDGEVKLSQEDEIRLVYTQVMDTDQVLYALSLLQAVLYVNPAAIIGNLVCSTTYDVSYSTSSDQSIGQKSLLEVILLSLTAFVRSEYPPSLDVSLSDEIHNLRVKSTAVEMTSFILLQFSLILASSTDTCTASTTSNSISASSNVVHNPSYVSALITLCDVQNVLLLTLSQIVHLLRTSSDVSNNEDDRTNGEAAIVNGNRVSMVTGSKSERGGVDQVSLRVLFIHILRCLHNLISLETQCIPSSPAAMTPNARHIKRSLSSAATNCIQPGLKTAAQPFLEALIIDILANRSLTDLHTPLLHMFSAILPSIPGQLEDLAPKVLRQLCRNLETSVQTEKIKMERVSSREGLDSCSSSAADGGLMVVSNVHALVNIIHYFLFGEFPTRGVTLKHNPLNRFWDANCLGNADYSEEATSPTSKQPSTMSWLFGVFVNTAQNKAASSPVGAKSPKLGQSHIKVGRSILLLLPAVYNALTEVWTWFSSRTPPQENIGGAIKSTNDSGIGGTQRGVNWIEVEKRRAEYDDIESLLLCLLEPLAANEPITFLSSISTVWLEWDLGTKVNPNNRKLSKRKDAFIALLHRIQVLSLEQFIRSVQFSFTSMARADDFESSTLRQKYLLHFFYKYISSPLQSWEELAGCHVVMVLFLRDCYTQCYNGTSDSLLANCHLLCMLTSILHVYICRVPGLEKKQKKERKELQDLTLKLCEVLSSAAGCSPLPPPHERHPSPPPPHPQHQPHTRQSQTESDGFEVVEHSDLHIKQKKDPIQVAVGDIRSKSAPSQMTGTENSHSAPPSPSHITNSKTKGVTAGHVRMAIPTSSSHQPLVSTATVAGRPQKNVTDPSATPGAQALAVLASTVSHFIDGVFGSSEKEKILSLLKCVLHNIWPHLHNHSVETQKLYHNSVKLLSSLSGFQATRKAWRRETFDLFMANNFFVMKLESLLEWKVLVDNLMTQDKTTFRDLLTRLTPAGLAPGLSNIFTTAEQEALNVARVVKRMAFAILSAETDQYTSYLPDIQERLSDCLKLQRHPVVSSEVFLSFRTLLLKFSFTHLLSFWPAIVAETLSTLQDLETDLTQELCHHKTVSTSHLNLYLSVSKLLYTAWTLPSHYLPHFQYLQWGFCDVGSPHSMSSYPGTGPVYRICSLFSSAAGMGNQSDPHSIPRNCGEWPHLHGITSLRDLAPFFSSLTLHHSPASPATPSRHSSTLFGAHHITSGGQSVMQINSVERELYRDFLEPFS